MGILKKKIRLETIGEGLRKHSTAAITAEKRKQMRESIILFTKTHEPAEEFGFSFLIKKIQNITAQLKPDSYFRVLLKEKLITLVEYNRSAGLWRIFGFSFRLSRRAVAAFVMFFFAAGIFLNFTLGVQRVEAAEVTVVKETAGHVSVLRNAERLQVSPGFLLKADDVVSTGSGSTAVIQFLDQSISRLAENTEVKIAKLFVNPLDKTETTVELILNKGRLWARVVNLIDNISRFQVKAENAVAVARRKAAFDVTIVSKGKAKVAAVQNKVDLVVATDTKVVETALVNGYSAEVKTNIVSSAPKIRQSSAQRDDWITQNLAQDKVYIEEVKQDAQDKLKGDVKVLPGNPLYAVKELSQTTGIAFTLGGVERQKKIVGVVQSKFAEAEALLEKGDKEKAAVHIGEFQAQLQGVYAWLNEYEKSNPAAAIEFKKKIEEILNGYQKQLALVLPTDPLYLLKDGLAEVQVGIAAGPVQKTEAKLEQASDKLLEAHDLVSSGNEVAATEQMHVYAKAVAEVVSEVKQLSSDEKEQAVSMILDKKVEDLKVLKAIQVAQPDNKNETGVSADRQAESEQKELLKLDPETLTVSGSTTAIVGSSSAAGSSSGPFAIDSQSTVNNKEAVQTESEDIKGAADAAFQKTVSDAKTETLTQMGEALAGTSKTKPSVDVLRKLEEIKQMDVNGKQVVDVTLTRNRVLIKSDESVISIGRQVRPSAPLEGTPTQNTTLGTTAIITPVVMPPTANSSLPIANSEIRELRQGRP